MKMIEKIAGAIGGVYVFARHNDFTVDRVDGYPIEICKYGDEDTDEIIVIRRFSGDADISNALEMVKNNERAKAALQAIRRANSNMVRAGDDNVVVGADVYYIFMAMIDAALSEADHENDI